MTEGRLSDTIDWQQPTLTCHWRQAAFKGFNFICDHSFRGLRQLMLGRNGPGDAHVREIRNEGGICVLTMGGFERATGAVLCA
jgi:hypothetical protein